MYSCIYMYTVCLGQDCYINCDVFIVINVLISLPLHSPILLSLSSFSPSLPHRDIYA